jgi:hypothetical protein
MLSHLRSNGASLNSSPLGLKIVHLWAKIFWMIASLVFTQTASILNESDSMSHECSPSSLKRANKKNQAWTERIKTTNWHNWTLKSIHQIFRSWKRLTLCSSSTGKGNNFPWLSALHFYVLIAFRSKRSATLTASGTYSGGDAKVQANVA